MDRIPGGIKVVLASKSPRRREYTAKICDNFSVITEDTDETLPADIHPRDGVRVLAERKGEAVIAAHPSDCADALVIAADTLDEEFFRQTKMLRRTDARLLWHRKKKRKNDVSRGSKLYTGDPEIHKEK